MDLGSLAFEYGTADEDFESLWRLVYIRYLDEKDYKIINWYADEDVATAAHDRAVEAGYDVLSFRMFTLVK